MIHPTAIVDPGAALGLNVDVGPFAWIGPDVTIGEGYRIGPRVTILPFTSLGGGCQVHTGAVLGDVPQDTSYVDCRSEVRIGENCCIREYVTVHRGTKPDTVTEIGAGCFVMAFAHVAHNAKLADGAILGNGTQVAGYVSIGERAFVAAHTMIHQFVKVGRIAMLGGGCAVTKDVPPFCMLAPVSQNRLMGLNAVGMRRAGLSGGERLQIRKAFKILYGSGLSVSNAVAAIRQEFQSGPALEFCEFVAASERGIVGGPRAGRDSGE